ncbi:PstS family phosphate ABC transporter substrate-binding protein (plasmid) [Nostoc sp. C052]|uniref:PstS family phosphate ABC transporter substrate-binding protein n=1 Tax=Nostoc sp. C052 TaxID=2576902 RepID=UPI0015C40B55|nr:PstS family phosphate ABC transporter substrate-binding protein [Nostoc sp. C052]QLE46287.1 PstS family phosphate ABC transporter substrate-binding protein [Nostoc sp. C052]
MNTAPKELALALGMLALTTSCTVASNTSTQTQQSQKVTEVRDSGNATATIKIDGSSTVYPITQAIAKDYRAGPKNRVQVAVNISGTTGGFEKFCAGETDISNASRPILKAEMETCKKNGVAYMEFPIAFDALTVAVNPQNDWAKDITVAELKKIWEPEAQGKITRWNQVRASWPDRPMNLYGAGKKSGTFDYFTEATVGKTRASRNDYTASEDDEILVNDIIKDPNALGYFGYSYYEKHQNKLKALAIDNGRGAVLPSRQTVEKVQYQPLARPLFIYVNFRDKQDKGLVNKFVEFYIDKAPVTASAVGYIPLPDESKRLNYVHLYQGKIGTVFGGKAEMNLTIGELLRKEGQF